MGVRVRWMGLLAESVTKDDDDDDDGDARGEHGVVRRGRAYVEHERRK